MNPRYAGILKQLGDYAGNAKRGFMDDLGIGGEDVRRVGHLEQEKKGLQAEAPKWDQMMQAWHLGNRVKQGLGMASPERLAAERERGINLKSNEGPGYRAGQVAGDVAGDLVQDGTRRIWWLLNALQASGEVINEKALDFANKNAHKLNPEKLLYGKHNVKNKITGEALTPKNQAAAIEQGVARLVDNKLVPNRGYSIAGTGDDAVFQERNFKPGHIGLLAVPTGVAINSGLGLLTPFGGAEGYKAAIPNEEDPTKTDNVLGEVALKYFMGRTGNLLPYDEFVKVRPDVSKDEYNRYQAFKYDKSEDWNPLDGDLTLLGGAIKTTDEGIHGPELQFLGRSLPLTTGIVPYATSLAGGMAGVASKRPIAGGMLGGLGGLVAGQIGGNLIEGERRRRNKEENERDTMGEFGRVS